MANHEDVRMLIDSINGVGNAAVQRRQQDFERQQSMQRLALEAQLRDVQEKRYDAQQAHYGEIEKSNNDRADAASRRADAEELRAQNAEKQPKIQAYLKDSKTGSGMSFQGTYEQLQAIQKGYGQTHPDGDLTITPEPPASQAKHEVGRVTVGGASHIFYDQENYDKFLQGMKDQGIKPDSKSSASDVDESDVEIKHDADPGKDAQTASSGFLGIGAHDASPAVPPSPAWVEHIKRKLPRGQLTPLSSLSQLSAPPAAASVAAPAASPATSIAPPVGGWTQKTPQQPQITPDDINSALTTPIADGSPAAPSSATPAGSGNLYPATPAQPKRVKQNGIIYDFDGSNYVVSPNQNAP